MQGNASAARPADQSASRRNANASLLSAYAPNHWLIRNFQLEAEAKELEKEVEAWKEKVTDVNRNRRLYQVRRGICASEPTEIKLIPDAWRAGGDRQAPCIA